MCGEGMVSCGEEIGLCSEGIVLCMDPNLEPWTSRPELQLLKSYSVPTCAFAWLLPWPHQPVAVLQYTAHAGVPEHFAFP